jgi:hypothetical protein
VLGKAGFAISVLEISEMLSEPGFKGPTDLSYVFFPACGAG